MLASAARAAVRTLLLLVTLEEYLLRFLLLRLRLGRTLTLAERARWMSAGCSVILDRLGWTILEQGDPAANGLIVSNHLSHLDILFYSAATGCIFCSKSEVRRWPLFGLLARCGGTLFISRERPAAAAASAALLQAALTTGIPVLLFPEGTSSDGAEVLPFHSMLFQPAVRCGASVAAAALTYSAKGGSERDLCYYGDRCFVPHLLRCMGLPAVWARIDWLGQPATYACRKQAARSTWTAVARARRQPATFREPRAETGPPGIAAHALTQAPLR